MKQQKRNARFGRAYIGAGWAHVFGRLAAQGRLRQLSDHSVKQKIFIKPDEWGRRRGKRARSATMNPGAEHTPNPPRQP